MPARDAAPGSAAGRLPGPASSAGRRGERGRAASLADVFGRRRARAPRGTADGQPARADEQSRRGGGGGLVAYLTARLIEIAPRIPVRDLATLRAQFPGLDAEQLADKLISSATKGTAAVGAGVGAAAALPTPPAMAVELATETLGVAGVEIKLIAELHEVYGLRAPGNVSQRATAYVASWSSRRGVDVLKHGSFTSALSGQLKRELRQRLVRRTARNVPTLMPFMIGAAIGGVINRRDTRKLAKQIREDLRARAVSWDKLERADSPRPGPRGLPGGAGR